MRSAGASARLPLSSRSSVSRSSSRISKTTESENESEFSGLSLHFAKQKLYGRGLWPDVGNRSQRDTLHESILGIGGDLLNKYGASVAIPKVSAESSEVYSTIQSKIDNATRKVEEKWKKLYIELIESNQIAMREKAAAMKQAYDDLESDRMYLLRRDLEKEKTEALQQLEKRLRADFENRVQQLVDAKVKELENQIRRKLEDDFKQEVEDRYLEEKRKNDRSLSEAVAEEHRKSDDRLRSAVLEEQHVQMQRSKQAFTLLEMLSTKHGELIQNFTVVEKDFFDLQNDYKRFMDHTDGLFHSDFMMKLREHGAHLSGKARLAKPDYTYADNVRLFLLEHGYLQS